MCLTPLGTMSKVKGLLIVERALSLSSWLFTSVAKDLNKLTQVKTN